MQRLNESSAGGPGGVRNELPGQIVLVLQGGGALGSYQAGVYQALQEAGIEPDWIIGTSIGAINAGLIAGNEPQRRLQRLHAFWSRVQRTPQ
jgi:NTE family protein